MCFTSFIRSNIIIISRFLQIPRNATRALHSSQVSSFTQTSSTISFEEDLNNFVDVFPQIVRDLTEDEAFKDIPQVNKWFVKVLQYNVYNSSKVKGLQVPRTFKALADVSDITTENIKLANIMGWCFEMLQSFTLMHDDILDNSEVRRKTPSWYSLKKVGVAAINDGVFLEGASYPILKRYFSSHRYYLSCVDLFHNIIMIITAAQSLDLILAAEGKTNLNSLTLKNYNILAMYKAGYFPFYFPITLGMYLSNKFDSDLHKQVKPLLMEMGYLIMVENDLSDVFDDTNPNDLIGTDIAEGRCTWMIATALERATDAQRNIFKAHYGKTGLESTLIVKNLYEELDLFSICKSHIAEKLCVIRNEVQRISKGSPHKEFFKYLNSIVILKNWDEIQFWRS